MKWELYNSAQDFTSFLVKRLKMQTWLLSQKQFYEQLLFHFSTGPFLHLVLMLY